MPGNPLGTDPENPLGPDEISNRGSQVYKNHLKPNVDISNVISVGLSIIDCDGYFPPLNVRFNIQWDKELSFYFKTIVEYIFLFFMNDFS